MITDPPVCENTTYLFPRECQNCVGEPSVEPHVIYNITASTHLMKDYKNYEYDYPPSTGSYRAASIIEPVDTDANKNNIFSHAEPLYDEIPCRGRQEQEAEMTYENQSISLYMNTSPVRKLSELK
ncbi:hypothetical protein NQ315_002924 [Exocentrus adspersus]|uniref:Uncharacterized protein n=1 Tax=Exocentrus adspersus TaxID=1586481 RepID=A0AAV8V8X3_9CUCU|nr:hypothetical protein NQ315_002924 [Exocentrus adspersus]